MLPSGDKASTGNLKSEAALAGRIVLKKIYPFIPLKRPLHPGKFFKAMFKLLSRK
jgi:hypothetical protein